MPDSGGDGEFGYFRRTDELAVPFSFGLELLRFRTALGVEEVFVPGADLGFGDVEAREVKVAFEEAVRPVVSDADESHGRQFEPKARAHVGAGDPAGDPGGVDAGRCIGLERAVFDLPPEWSIFFLRGGLAIGMPTVGTPDGVEGGFRGEVLGPAGQVGFLLGECQDSGVSEEQKNEEK